MKRIGLVCLDAESAQWGLLLGKISRDLDVQN